MRIASLVGRLATGDLVNVGLADSSSIDGLVARYRGITEAGGKIVSGKKVAQLIELYFLASNTAGGELKTHRRWRPPEVVA